MGRPLSLSMACLTGPATHDTVIRPCGALRVQSGTSRTQATHQSRQRPVQNFPPSWGLTIGKGGATVLCMSEQRTLRDQFIARFGEANAVALEAAADVHASQGMSSGHPGECITNDNGFRYTLLSAIDFECVSKEPYRKWHGINIDPESFKAWCIKHANLGAYEGQPPSAIGFFAGAFNDYV